MAPAATTRVLLVDSDPREVTLIRRVLASTGVFEVLVARNGEFGQQILSIHQVDAIIVDQSLADTPGIDFVRSAVVGGFHGAVIVTADEMDRVAAATALQLGVANFVVKPPTWPAPLPEMLVRALERSRLMQQNRQLQEQLKLVESERDAISPRDPVTELYREWYFEECRVREAARAKRLGLATSIIEMHMANFLRYRALFGNQQADEWLRLVAQRFGKAIRTTDVLAHFGKGLFKVLLPDCDAAGAQVVTGRLRQTVEVLKRQGQLPRELTVDLAGHQVSQARPAAPPPPDRSETGETRSK